MKKIERAEILGELTDKFTLREYEREPFLFGEFVVPTYDIGDHVKNWVIERSRPQVTGNGMTHFFELTGGEKWKLRRLAVIHETGANFDIDQVFHYSLNDGTALNYIFYDTTSPITSGTVKVFEFPQDIAMKYKDRLSINVSNFVGGGYVAAHVLKEVETIR